MNLKKYIQLVALLALPMLILIVGGLEAQYRGSGRPLGRQENLDSLGKKADTTVTNQLQTEIDSTQDTLDVMYGNQNFWHPADSTLLFNLQKQFFTNTIQLTDHTTRDDSTADSNWADLGSGTHAHETSTKLVGEESVKITIPNGGQLGGARIDITDTDFTHFTNGDTSITADWLIIALSITSAYIDSLGSSDLQWIFSCDEGGATTNCYYGTITPGSLSNGWNFIKAQKSALDLAGSPNWNDIKVIIIRNNSTATAGEVVFYVDHIQLIKDDSGEPNPFQPDWTQEGDGNIWLVEESDVLAAMDPADASTSSYLLSAKSYHDYEIWGSEILGTTYPIFPSYGNNRRWQSVGINNVRAYDVGAFKDFTPNSLTLNPGDTYNYRIIRQDSVWTIALSEQGKGIWEWFTYKSSMGTAAQLAINFYGFNGRKYSFGVTDVAFAAEAGVAQRLKDINFERGAEGLEITIGDSVYHLVIDSVRAK